MSRVEPIYIGTVVEDLKGKGITAEAVTDMNRAEVAAALGYATEKDIPSDFQPYLEKMRLSRAIVGAARGGKRQTILSAIEAIAVEGVTVKREKDTITFSVEGVDRPLVTAKRGGA